MYFITDPLICTCQLDYRAFDGELGSHSHVGSFEVKTYFLNRSDKDESKQSSTTIITVLLI